jgi:hypothetical protein
MNATPTYQAKVSRTFNAPPELDDLARRLAGPALVRFAAALWKQSEAHFDLLGCAIRLCREGPAAGAASDDDQDLLFATTHRPWTMPISPFLTNVHDFLGNDYFAVSAFDVGLGRKVYLRLHPARPSSTRSGSRVERLAREVRRGLATMNLSISERSFGPWAPLVTVALDQPADVEDGAVRFLTHRDGRGMHPRGLIQAVHRGAGWVSERARHQRPSLLASPRPAPEAAFGGSEQGRHRPTSREA